MQEESAGGASAPASASSTRAPAAVLHGQCSWTDELLVHSGFYPPSCKGTDEQLKFYAMKFPCVEIDTSSYAIPSAKKVEGWVARTPPGFTFHFKIYGLLCGRDVAPATMPWQAKGLLSETALAAQSLSMADISEEVEDAVWGAFHASIQPAADRGRLGLVVFQFPPAFGDTAENRAWIQRCAAKMKPHTIAVELRGWSWYAPASDAPAFLRSLGVVRVTVDERDVVGYAPEAIDGNPDVPRPVPLEPEPTHDRLAYVRVHRRAGPRRLLTASELQRWVERLATLRTQVSEAVIFAWNTNEADQSVRNARALSRLVEPDGLAEWERRVLDSRGGGIRGFFARAEARGAAEEGEREGPAPTRAGPPPSSPAPAPTSPSPAPSGPPPAPSSPAPASPAGGKRPGAARGGGKRSKKGEGGPPPGQTSLTSFFGKRGAT